MKKKSKRLAALLTSAAMMFSFFGEYPSGTFDIDWSLSVSAANNLKTKIDTGASVTLKDSDNNGFYDINNADELYAFAAIVNGGNDINVELKNDISVDPSRGWTPIGPSIADAYSGTFEGNGKKISGINITLNLHQNEGPPVGIFACLRDGTIQNLTFADGNISVRGGRDVSVGGICGRNQGRIINCTNSSTITGQENVGGICGENNGTSSYVLNCRNTGNITAVDNAEACGGGICGRTWNLVGPIVNCYNSGKISSSAYAGGIIAKSAFGGIINCYNTGDVESTGGNLCGGIVAESTLESIFNCYNTGTVTSTGSATAPIVKDITPGDFQSKVINCYYLSDSETDDIDGTCFMTADDFKNGSVAYKLHNQSLELSSTYKFNGDIWGQRVGADASPVFNGLFVYKYLHNGADFYSNGNTEAVYNNGVYEISSAEQLRWFVDLVNTSNSKDIDGKLTADIDLSGVNWTQISSYAGTFDGNGYTINNLCKNAGLADGSRCGLIQTLESGGTVTNLIISDAELWSSHSAGAIAAVNNGTISKCIVKDSTIQLGASHGLAAIAGTNNGTVTNCGVVNCFLQRRWGAANVSGYAIGAVVEDNSGTVSNCFSYGCKFSNSPNLFAIVESGNAPVNCYYYTNAIVSDTVATAKTADQFASGEVAYLLNGDQTAIVWGQKIGTDDSPVLNGDKVYRNENLNCNGSGKEPASYNYLNEEMENVADAHIFTVDSNGFCTKCGACEQPELKDGVYQISNAGELYWFAEYVRAGNVSVNAVLMNDISVNGTKKQTNVSGYNGKDSVSWRQWIPIGKDHNNKYIGTFDGNNFTISGLYFNDTNQQYVGLFGYIGSDAEIKNVGVINSYFKGEYFVGGVCGWNQGGKITNCCNTGTITGSNSIGGISGYNTEKGTITNCYNTGNISGYLNVGGICGLNRQETAITNCYNATGSVSGTENVGGICGTNWNKIENCYNTGTIIYTGTKDYPTIGNLCGYAYSGLIKNCYYKNNDGKVVGYNYDTTLTDVLFKTEDEFKSGEVAYLLGNAWGQTLTGENVQNYPVLNGAKVYGGNDACGAYYSNKTHESIENGLCTACGKGYQEPTQDANGVYQISNAANLLWFAKYVNNGEKSANAVLIDNIDMTDLEWTPICQTDLYYNGYGDDLGYSGTFDGQGYVIRNLRVNGPNGNAASAGLFGTVSGTIKNLGMESFNFQDSGIDVRAGAIVGQLIKSGKVSNCYVKDSTVNATNHVGGAIAGCVYEGRVENCYVFDTTVSGERVGTVVGDACADGNDGNGTDRPGYVIKCYTNATNLTSGRQNNDTDGSGNKYIDNNLTDVTKQQFASGEIAYLLNGSSSENVTWYQTLGTDAYPVLNGEHGTVYSVYKCDGTTSAGYSNKNKNEPHIDENCDEYCDICNAIYDGIGAHLAGYSVSLNGSIGVNFHMDLTQDVLDDNEAYMLFTLPNGTTQKVMVSDAKVKESAVIEGKTYYIFTCNVAAKEMTDTIQAQLITSDGSKTQVYEYSVREYADRILEGSYDDKTKELVKAMLHYGAYSQKWFDYNTTNLANEGLDTLYLSSVTASSLSEYQSVKSYNDKVGSFTTAYLTLESDTAINLKFKSADGVDVEDLTFTVNGNPISPVKSGDVYLITLTGIQASALDTMYEFVVADGEGNESRISYSAMSYTYAVANSEMDQKLKDVTAALRIFNLRANDKFE